MRADETAARSSGNPVSLDGPARDPAVARTTSAADVVHVASLSKRYGEVVAADDVSFALPAGSVTGLLGPNGAGKTTVLRVLLGLAEPHKGEALILGRRYRDLDRPMHVVGAVLESGDFDPGRNGRDHLRVLAFAADVPQRRVDEALAVVGLARAAKRAVRTYSLGMRQRLTLAAALLGSPQLLVLDEPANGLDAKGVHWLRTFLRGFAADGGTVLVSSHVLAEIAQTVDHVVIVDRGHVVARSSLAELVADGKTLEEVYLALTSEDAA
ncbi:MAG: ATP-binding cassette domain-containing protein [Chloroflexi bacterium]|nr:MAG: ATP-binding cassette domain-containing protein [Chloroflexota bacterium]